MRFLDMKGKRVRTHGKQLERLNRWSERTKVGTEEWSRQKMRKGWHRSILWRNNTSEVCHGTVKRQHQRPCWHLVAYDERRKARKKEVSNVKWGRILSVTYQHSALLFRMEVTWFLVKKITSCGCFHWNTGIGSSWKRVRRQRMQNGVII